MGALGLKGQTGRYHVFVLDRQGRELGRLVQDETSPEDEVEEMVRLISQA